MKLYDVIVAEKKEKSLDIEENSQDPKKIVYHQSFSVKKLRRQLLIYGLLLIFIATIYGLGVKFVFATIKIEERKIPFNIQGTSIDLEHEKSADSGRLYYQAMVVNYTINREIFGSQVSVVKSQAQGEVVFLNEYSKSSVTIPTNTTIISQQGNKKYKTKSTISVPGYTQNGSVKTPGASKAVEVVADSIGAEYNTSGDTFYVSSYTGSKKTGLIARSSGSITGGEDGALHTVIGSEKDSVSESLKTQLIEQLKRMTRAQIPEGFVSYPQLQVISIDPNSLILSGSGVKFPASLSGSMVTYLIPVKEFQQAVATNVLSDHTEINVSIPALSTLNVTPSKPLPQTTTDFPEVLTVKVSGQAVIITNVDEKIIKNTIMGQKKKEFDNLMKNITQISNASYSLYPFWAPYFPWKTERIKLKIQ